MSYLTREEMEEITNQLPIGYPFSAQCPWIALEVRSDNLEVKCHCQLPADHTGRHHWPKVSKKSGHGFERKNLQNLTCLATKFRLFLPCHNLKRKVEIMHGLFWIFLIFLLFCFAVGSRPSK